MAKQVVSLLNKHMAKQPEPDPAAAEPTRARPKNEYGEVITVRFPPNKARLLRVCAAERGLKLQELVQQAFDVWLRENGDPRS